MCSLNIKVEVKECLFLYYLYEKVYLIFCSDQLAHILTKSRRKGGGERRDGKREGQKSSVVLFLEKPSLVSLLVRHFQWKYSISAGQNARMFYLMEFPTQKWNSSYCCSCLGS